MKIGFYMKWNMHSYYSKGNVIGDELYAHSMIKAFRKKGIEAELYAPNNLPEKKMDVMIYINDNEPCENWAKKHLIYVQNAYSEGSYNMLKKFQYIGYDGYAFISNKLLKRHIKSGYKGIFLPFGVDTTLFYPRESNEKYMFDISYIGNDIKGQKRTEKYLIPAIKYNFGLYGNWRLKKWKFWENKPYQKILNKVSRGKIPQKDVPLLYSSSKINLNFTALDCVEWDVITLRTYEVLACKGFLITDRVLIAEKILKDCVIFTDGNKDLEEKIEFYLKNEFIRKKISQNGYDYVINNATIDKYMDYLYNYIQEIL